MTTIKHNPVFDRLPCNEVDFLPGYKEQSRELFELTFHDERRDYYKAKIEEYKDWIIENYTEDVYELLQLSAERAWIIQDCQMIYTYSNEKDYKLSLESVLGKEIGRVVITVIFGHIIQISAYWADRITLTIAIKDGLKGLINYVKTLEPLTYTEDREVITRAGDVFYL